MSAGYRGEADRHTSAMFGSTTAAPFAIHADPSRKAAGGRAITSANGGIAMSDAPVKIWTQCPVCRAKYTVLLVAVGHHARCKNCSTRFRVEEHNPHPTEEDILRWLNETGEDNEREPYPRIITGSQRPAVAVLHPRTAERSGGVAVQSVPARPN